MLGTFLTKPYVYTQGKEAQTISYACSYLQIVMCLSLGLFFQVTLERLMQATGRTILSMISQTIGAVSNIILDYLMIFGVGPFPKMGIAGAAYATVIGQTIAAVVGLILNIKYNHDIKISIKLVFSPKIDVIRAIYFVGIPTIAMMSVGSVMTYVMNIILGGIGGEAAMSVFGIYFRLQSFFFMPVFGLNNGIIPILAYNLGARKKDRIDQALKFALALAICIMMCGTICFWLIPGPLMELFNAPLAVEKMGVIALRIISLSFPLAAVGIILSSVYQAFSESIYSLLISLGRQLVVLCPAAYLLSLFGKVDYVWFAFVIAEMCAMVFSLKFFKKVYNKKVAVLSNKIN